MKVRYWNVKIWNKTDVTGETQHKTKEKDETCNIEATQNSVDNLKAKNMRRMVKNKNQDSIWHEESGVMLFYICLFVLQGTKETEADQLVLPVVLLWIKKAIDKAIDNLALNDIISLMQIASYLHISPFKIKVLNAFLLLV